MSEKIDLEAAIMEDLETAIREEFGEFVYEGKCYIKNNRGDNLPPMSLVTRVDYITRSGTVVKGSTCVGPSWYNPSAYNYPLYWRRSDTEKIPETASETADATKSNTRKHSHYFKDITGLDVLDVYRVMDLFEVTDAAISHAAKKLLVSGGRGGGKDISTDIDEVIDTLQRWKAMQEENKHR